MKTASPHYDLGVAIACEEYRLDGGDLVEKSAFVNTLRKDANFRAQVGLSVQGALDLMGEGQGLLRCVIKEAFEREVAGDARVSGICDDVVDSFLCAHGDEQLHVKQALAGGAIADILARIGLSGGRGAIGATMYGAGAAGAGLGTLAWALNRGVNQDRVDNEALKARLETYRRMTNDIQSRLKERGVDMEESDRDDIQEITGADMVESYND